MRQILRGLVTFMLVVPMSGCQQATDVATVKDAGAPAPNSVADTWAVTASGPYASVADIPEDKVSWTKFQGLFHSALADSAARTLADHDDVLPHFEKFVHSIGICYKGTWSIDAGRADNDYTGYFANGSTGVVIARASEAMGRPLAGGYRSFGFALKLYPTTDANDPRAYRSANVFTVDDLGGTLADSYLDTMKTNHPKSSLHASSALLIATIGAIAKSIGSADSNATVRKVYEVSELGVAPGAPVKTPSWFGVKADKGHLFRADDFRDELQLSNLPGGTLELGIYVGDSEDAMAANRIGTIRLTEQALSDGCDHRLHFHHPRDDESADR